MESSAMSNGMGRRLSSGCYFLDELTVRLFRTVVYLTWTD